MSKLVDFSMSGNDNDNYKSAHNTATPTPKANFKV